MSRGLRLRCAPHEGQNPRRLQLRLRCGECGHDKLLALMKRGSSLPVVARCAR